MRSLPCRQAAKNPIRQDPVLWPQTDMQLREPGEIPGQGFENGAKSDAAEENYAGQGEGEIPFKALSHTEPNQRIPCLCRNHSTISHCSLKNIIQKPSPNLYGDLKAATSEHTQPSAAGRVEKLLQQECVRESRPAAWMKLLAPGEPFQSFHPLYGTQHDTVYHPVNFKLTRCQVFEYLHNRPHHGKRPTIKLVTDRFI
ncbi:hypothetical protein ACTXT7_017237 [Hymenolepis weldensis]